MNNYYSYSTVTGLMTAFALITVLFVLAIIGYIFQSLALYTIAKKRDIKNPWLAWIPIGNFYVIGKIGDYYFAKKNKNYNLAIVFPILFAVALILKVVSNGVFFGAIGGLCLIAAVIIQYVCIYQFFKSVNSYSAVAMLVVGIIFSFIMPFILFTQRNKDDKDAFVQPDNTNI